MFKRFACLLILILVSACLFSEESGGALVNKEVGYALLDAVGQTFHEMAVSGTGGVEKVTEAVLKFMADARKARDQNQIDAVFFARYRRILAIIKLAVAPDPEAIGQVANAIADEIINLHLYLDNIETKEKLRRGWDEKMSGAAKKEE